MLGFLGIFRILKVWMKISISHFELDLNKYFNFGGVVLLPGYIIISLFGLFQNFQMFRSELLCLVKTIT